MLQALRICLFGLGAAAVAIALSIFLLGATATAGLSEALYAAVSGWRGPPSPAWPATMDSELRFYAALWGAYGALLLRLAWRLERDLNQTPWMAAVFFAGGVGRLLSRLSLGPPHPVFTLLMAIELGLPVVLVGLWLGAKGTRAD